MIAALALVAALARGADDVALEATPFPPGAPAPGYAGVRVRVAAASDRHGTLRLRSADGSTTEVDLDLRAGSPSELVVAVWRIEPRPIEVSFGDVTRSVDPGAERSMVLAVGRLAEAEAASDAFDCGLPDVLVLPELPDVADECALDGFGGIAAKGVPAALVAGYRARGGAVDHGPRRVARAGVAAASVLPPEGLLPRDLFGVASAPVRIALAGALASAAAAAFLRRRPFVALAGGGAVALLTTSLTVLASRAREPLLVVVAGADAALALTSEPKTGEAPLERAVYPCGARAPISRRLRSGTVRWDAPSAVLLATPTSPPEPLEGSVAVDPLAAPGSTLRALASAASAVVGGPSAVEIDAASGRLVLRRAR
ncbi:MAG TPA: hypothetical protein VKE69_00370 [Planctomycetota bacterium]|nr:hypothetical protein [Planctomycetota bacterium]